MITKLMMMISRKNELKAPIHLVKTSMTRSFYVITYARRLNINVFLLESGFLEDKVSNLSMFELYPTQLAKIKIYKIKNIEKHASKKEFFVCLKIYK